MSARQRRRAALYAAAGIATHPDTTEPPQEALSAPQRPETRLPAPVTHPEADPPPTSPLSDAELDALAALAADLPPGTRPDRRRAVILERLRQASDTP